NVGLEVFAREVSGGVHVDWRPPAGPLVGTLTRLLARSAEIDAANADALSRLVGGEPVLVDCRPAREAIDLPERVVLHAGPPIEWERMCAPLQAAILCAVRYEGWATDDDAARRLVERDAVKLAPCHHWQSVGPMTGIITGSMPVFVVENRA